MRLGGIAEHIDESTDLERIAADIRQEIAAIKRSRAADDTGGYLAPHWYTGALYGLRLAHRRIWERRHGRRAAGSYGRLREWYREWARRQLVERAEQAARDGTLAPVNGEHHG